MEIVNLSYNDDIGAIARKCNTNFKQLAFAADQQTKRQGRTNDRNTAAAIDEAVGELVETTIPQEVSSQISSLDIPGTVSREVSQQIISQDIPGMVSDAVDAEDIPGMVSDEVASKVPIGFYLISPTDPALIYDGTTWSQVDSIATVGSMTIPLWQRTA